MHQAAAEVSVGGSPKAARWENLAELYGAIAPRAVRLAYLMTSDHAFAEDVVQDAFIRVAGRVRSLRDPNAFEAYLRRAIINEILSKRRTFARRERRQQRAARGEAHSVSPMVVVDDRVGLLRGINSLPIHQRTAILLKYWMDLSDSDIADTMNCALGTAKSRIARGLDTLRRTNNYE